MFLPSLAVWLAVVAGLIGDNFNSNEWARQQRLMAGNTGAVVLGAAMSGPVLVPSWLGANVNYEGFVEMPEMSSSFGMTSALKTVEYQRIADLGVKTVRSFVGMDWWGTGEWTNFKTWVSAMKTRGINVWINPWWFTESICSSNATSCTPTGADETAFKTTLSLMLGDLLNTSGLSNVTGLVLFTEPVFGNHVPAGYVGLTDYYAHIGSIVRAQVAADDAGRTPVLPRVQIIGGQEQSSGADAWVQYLQANAAGTYDALTSHSYCGTPPFGPLGLVASACDDYPTLVARMKGWVADSSPRPFTFDEFNVLGSAIVAGNNNYPYRWTGDEGVRMVEMAQALIAAGSSSAMIWMAQDQYWVVPPTDIQNQGGTVYQQQFGLARWLGDSESVWPVWYAWALLANLGGGSSDTVIHQTTSATPLVHGTQFSVPNGVGGCAMVGGCASYFASNEGDSPLPFIWSFQGAPPLSTTLYRYTYNGGNPPSPGPTKAAYIPPWDMSVSAPEGAPVTVLPAHSVVAWSTMNISAPAATNLGTRATTTASSNIGLAAHVNDGDTTHLARALTGWLPTGAGGQYVELDWPSAQTFDRVEIDLPGTSWPTVFANPSDTNSPTVLDAWTLQYWNRSTFVDFSPIVNVTSNTQVHRTHTFASVSTTKLRLAVASGAAAVNEIGVFSDAGPDTALALHGWTDGTANLSTLIYEKIAATSYTIVSGDTLEYDVFLLDRVPLAGAVDVTIDAGCSSTELYQVAGWVDQNAINAGPAGDISTRAYGTWYHRTVALQACSVGHTALGFALAGSNKAQTCSSGDNPCSAGTFFGAGNTAYFDNIQIKHAGGVTALPVYTDGAPATVQRVHSTGYNGDDIFVVNK